MDFRGKWTRTEETGSTVHILKVVSEFGDLHSRQSFFLPELDVDYSRALDVIGTGKFHVLLGLACGFMYLAVGLQNNLNAYILPSVHCDLHISSAQMGLLNAVFLAGGITSNFLWGLIADVLGRKTVVVYGMLVDGILTLCSSFSQHFYLLLVFRFLNGFVVGGPASLVFAYMGEFFPSKVRTRAICYVGTFWTLSWVIMPGAAWTIIPQTWSVEFYGITFNSWRLLVFLTALPSLTAAALLVNFPESPMFLLVQGKSKKALSTLAYVYAFNHKCNPSDFPVKTLKDPFGKSENDGSGAGPWMVMVRQIKLLFDPRTVGMTFLASTLFFTNMYGYYGLGLWLPEMFNRMTVFRDSNPDVPVTICSASSLSSAIDTQDQHTCSGNADIESSVFMQSVIMGLVSLIGNVMSGLLAGHLHRRTLPVVLMAISGICVVVIYFTTDVTIDLIIASIFQLAIGTANSVYNSLVVDMFPPNISGMGVCFAVLAGRVGGMLSNLAFGQLLDISCTVPVFLCAFIIFVGSIVSILIPKEPYTKEVPEKLTTFSGSNEGGSATI